MANVTEKDIINHLKEKIKFHQQEAKRIEKLLSAFTGSPFKETTANEPTPKKPAKPAKVTAVKPKKLLQVPTEYQPTLTINGKIAYALNQLGSGFNEDIAAKIAELQPSLKAAQVMKQISGVLSTLKTNGQLIAVKDGRKDKFSLAI